MNCVRKTEVVRVKAALLSASGFDAARLEEYLEGHPEMEIRLVWTATEPSAVLAALDHDPEVFLLDMRWRDAALQVAGNLMEAGVNLIICLFDRSDDPLMAEARAMGLPVFEWEGQWGLLAAHIRTAG